jgi:hypothetical protein
MANISEYRRLSRSISIHEPREPAAGQLIILATWLGATTKHVAKYTSLYESIAPNAKLLLIQAPMDSFLLPYSIQEMNIRPALDPIAQLLEECATKQGPQQLSTNPRILLHVFSNGGANNVLSLLRVWRSTTGKALPLSGLIIDSALAIGGVKQNFQGFQQSIPSGLMFKVIGPIAATYALLVLETSIALGRYPRPETAMRECFFDEALIQANRSQKSSVEHDTSTHTVPHKRICYFASKADRNTPFKDIVSHAEEARERGWLVDLHLWDDTQHCNHLGKHEEEYVKAVRSMWMLEPTEAAGVRSKL